MPKPRDLVEIKREREEEHDENQEHMAKKDAMTGSDRLLERLHEEARKTGPDPYARA